MSKAHYSKFREAVYKPGSAFKHGTPKPVRRDQDISKLSAVKNPIKTHRQSDYYNQIIREKILEQSPRQNSILVHDEYSSY